MNYVGHLAESVLVTVKSLYCDLNPATLSGCIDVIVVRQPDNSFKCSPFHVRFGKLGVLRSKEKVVDIEINGEPVDLHMKLGDNGEAFFVEELEEHESNIPFFLCTSPICKERCMTGAAQPSQGLGVSSTGVILRRRRRRRRRPRKREVLDTESDSDEAKKELLVPSSLSFLLCSDATYSSFSDVLEVSGSLQPPEIRAFSDGELIQADSFKLSRQPPHKSDSELEIKPQESFCLGAECHMKWIWGKLPQVNKLVQVKRAKSTKITAVDGTTPLVATSEHPGGVSSPAEPQDMPHSLPVSATEPTLTPQAENSVCRLKDVLRAIRAKTFLGASSVPQEQQKEDVSAVPDVEHFEGATAPRQAGSEGPASQLERQRRQGSIKRACHKGPRAIYLEDFSNPNHKPVALYLAESDTEQSLSPETDPRNPVSIELPSTSTARSPMDSDSMPTVALSLCGGLRDNTQISHEKFMEHRISYQQFAENPRLVSDPNLVIMINKKYYSWAVAGPIVLALQAFQKNIPESIIDELVKETTPKKDRRYWFWRRRESSTEEQQQPRPGIASLGALWRDLVQQRQEGKESPSENEPQHPGDTLAMKAPAQKPLPNFRKSLRLSSEQIGRLNLQDGPNEVAFSVTTRYQGTCRCEATIYLWNWNEKVVISDIDGTITRSDALGHILPQLGKDWTHPGIVKLFNKIHLNGYKFLYCSARAIGMAHITKGYLQRVNEQGCGLPMGPMLLSPSSLLSAFHREVIENNPEMFKIPCLTDIRKLFATKFPFYAGFGNTPHDVHTYKQVGLPESRIFTVNPKGELIQELTKNQKSTYEQLSELVEVFFPPVGHRSSAALVSPKYSHWRSSLPDDDWDSSS
ncbi:phosphatidate phosphatase LPIN3 [Zonotrichia leucophrys gambelii]|uniref:phosphatidate phosphatase LPIN3 n=1 Tax=Zonotrichia leucophrys gambelii TaxID=257770 RepID=UPI0031404722